MFGWRGVRPESKQVCLRRKTHLYMWPTVLCLAMSPLGRRECCRAPTFPSPNAVDVGVSHPLLPTVQLPFDWWGGGRKLACSQARGGGLGSNWDRPVETSCTSLRRYSSDGTSFAPMPSPSFLVCDTASSHMARPSPTSSTSLPSSATPPASSSAEEGDSRSGFSTLYPF